jgi:hypothetical protein
MRNVPHVHDSSRSSHTFPFARFTSAHATRWLSGPALALVLSVALLVGCSGGGGGSSSSSTTTTTTTTTYTVGGTVTGLATSASVVLQDNAGDNKTVSADGSFTFATGLANAAAYSVTVLTQPSGEVCTVTGGSGTIATANVTGVAVNCGIALKTASGTDMSASGTWSSCIYSNSDSRDEASDRVFSGATLTLHDYHYTSTDQSCSGTQTIDSTNVGSIAVNAAAAAAWTDGTTSPLVPPPLKQSGGTLTSTPTPTSITITITSGPSVGNTAILLMYVDDSGTQPVMYRSGNQPSGCADGANNDKCVTSRDPLLKGAIGTYDVWTAHNGTGATSRYLLSASFANAYIYAVGGVNSSGVVLDNNEQWDPSNPSNGWNTKTGMGTARQGFATAAVGNTIYAIGGALDSGGANYVALNQAYDTAGDVWATKAAMTTARTYLTAAAVGTTIYAIGGKTTADVATVEAYDTTTNTWSSKTDMWTARQWTCSAVVSGIVYVIGGYNGSQLNTVEAFDPAASSGAGSWLAKSPLHNGRYGLTCGAIGNSIYVVGGHGVSNTSVAPVEVYNTLTDTWTVKGGMLEPRYFLTGAAAVGRFFAIGGCNVSACPWSRVDGYTP